MSADERAERIEALRPCYVCGRPAREHERDECPHGRLTRDQADGLAGEVEDLLPGAEPEQRELLYRLAGHYWNAA